jgi:hypothetical protein
VWFYARRSHYKKMGSVKDQEYLEQRRKEVAEQFSNYRYEN